MTPSCPAITESAAIIRARKWLPHTYANYATEGRFRMYRHVHHIGEQIGAKIRKGGARLIINLPPRHTKSMLVSEWCPLWFLEHWPRRHVILCSYQADIAEDFGRKCRNEARSNPRVGVELVEDSKSSSRWNTPQGGGMITAGVGGAITGRGFHLGIIDDPLKNWKDAFSATIRRHQRDWFESTFYTRAEPGASMIVLNTRWHPKDLAGFLIDEHKDPWEVISLPAVAEAGDPLGRQPGEALCPERYDEQALAQIRAGIGPAKWDALYQQKPMGGTTGQLYKNYSEANLDKTLDIRPGHPVFLGVDFNIDPGMHMEVGQHFTDTGTVAFVHEIFSPRMNLKAAGEAFLTLWRSWPGQPEVILFGDPAGNATNINDGTTNWKLLKNMLRSAGVKIRDRVPAAHPGIIDSVLEVNEALHDTINGTRRMKIHPRCERLKTDLLEVAADEDGKPDKTDPDLTHASDIARYVIHSLCPIRGERIKTSGRIIA